MASLTALRHAVSKQLVNSCWTSCTRTMSMCRNILSSSRCIANCSSTALLVPRLLAPPVSVLVQSVAGMKMMGKLRRRCNKCYFIMINERLHVMCEAHPRHKQMQMMKRKQNTYVLTSASQHKIRPW